MRRAALLALLAALPLRAASPGPGHPLSLFDATALALKKNHDIVIEQESFRIAGASLTRADGSYDPFFRLDARYRDHTDALNSALSGAIRPDLGPSYTNLTSSLSLSQLLPTGGTVAVSGILWRDTAMSQFALLTPAYTTGFSIDLRQPLLQGLSIDPARRAIRVATLDKDRSVASLRRTVSDVVAAVERAYWTVVAARRTVAVARKTVALAETQKADTEARIEAGVLPESDLAQPVAEVERRKGELFSAEEFEKQAGFALKTLLLSDPADPLWNETVEPTDGPEAPKRTVDLSEALAESERRRPELQDASLLVARQDVEIEAARDRIKPQLDLVASYGRKGLAGTPNPNIISIGGAPIVVPDQLVGGLGQSYATIGSNEFPDAFVGLALALPIGNRSAKADAVIAEAQKRQLQARYDQTRQRVAVEVRNAALALETAAQRLEAARAGRAAAETQLRAETERFAVGLSTNFFVLTRQNELARAEFTETQALTDYGIALTALDRSVGTILEDRHISLAGDAPTLRNEGGSR
ncbi:MAG TPA: TolC family protein [Thermoanaerobaculia bacterium]|nr:TolC family protein [Thermoanaerobaculia bacterium]